MASDLVVGRIVGCTGAVLAFTRSSYSDDVEERHRVATAEGNGRCQGIDENQFDLLVDDGSS